MNADWKAMVEQYRILHAQNIGAFEGRSLMPHAWQIIDLIREYGSKSILDYGCGAGIQYDHYRLQDWFGFMPTLYDPAVPKFAAKPQGTFDGVIVSDVMEHIPESAVPDVVAEIVSYANQWVFFSICCREAKRILPNGMNAHCTIRSPNWWKDQIKPRIKARGLTYRIEWSL